MSTKYPLLNFHVKGVTIVQADNVDLGMTSADDFINVTFHRMPYEIFSNEGGPSLPAKIIQHGAYAVVTIPMTQWNDTKLDGIIRANGTSTNGALGILCDDYPHFSLTIKPQCPGATGYQFPYAMVIDEQTISDWGLKESKNLITVKCIFNPNDLSNPDALLYTVI